jgi:hypothetical protein
MDTAPPQQKVREVSPRAVKVVVKCVVFFCSRNYYSFLSLVGKEDQGIVLMFQ